MSFDRAWRKARLQVPKKREQRRVALGRPRPALPQQRHDVWAYDFIFERCTNGQVPMCLTIVDEHTRECLAIDVAGRIRSSHVIDKLSHLVSVYGAPRYLRSDNGPEFVARAVVKWLTERRIDTAILWRSGGYTGEAPSLANLGQGPRAVLP